MSYGSTAVGGSSSAGSVSALRVVASECSLAAHRGGLVESMDGLLLGLIRSGTVTRAGTPFDDAIRKQIANARSCRWLPRTRARAAGSTEIGYALGISALFQWHLFRSREMLSAMQAIRVGNVCPVCDKAWAGEFLALVLAGSVQETWNDRITTHEARTRCWLNSREVCCARVRRRAIFSSFSLPDAQPDDKVWIRSDSSQAK
jgi:hypothetical protein